MAETQSDSVQVALDYLYSRNRNPKPRQGKSRDYAAGIIREALDDGRIIAEIDSIIHKTDGELPDYYRRSAAAAHKAAAALNGFFHELQSPGGPELAKDSFSLAAAMLKARGLCDGEELSSTRIELQQVAKAMLETYAGLRELSSPRTLDPRGQPRHLYGPRIENLAKAWVDITGRTPGRSRVQNETPFGQCVGLALNCHDDLSRQINAALDRLGTA